MYDEIGNNAAFINVTPPVSAPCSPLKIVSGGQTGVDRAALDAAGAIGWPCGGWCPKGRRCETGVIPLSYPLRETPASAYAQRTAWNVRDSDATLLLLTTPPMGGTAFTLHCVHRLGRPYRIVRLDLAPAPDTLIVWLTHHTISTLNIAGPRTSEAAEIYPLAKAWLLQAFSALAQQ